MGRFFVQSTPTCKAEKQVKQLGPPRKPYQSHAKANVLDPNGPSIKPFKISKVCVPSTSNRNRRERTPCVIAPMSVQQEIPKNQAKWLGEILTPSRGLEFRAWGFRGLGFLRLLLLSLLQPELQLSFLFLLVLPFVLLSVV